MNGGVLDRVWFMMMNYNKETYNNLVQVSLVANKILKQDVFELHFMRYTPGRPPPPRDKYVLPYYEIFAQIVTKSSNRFFKIDDDIVYIHPGTFKNMIESKNSSQCFMHFANIVTNWRCNIKHQELGVYNEKVNPKNLKFEFDPQANCGWKSPECAELTLRTFLHYHNQGQLDKYQFHGLELINRKKTLRVSINLFMLDKDLINIKTLQEAGPIHQDDEKWWTQMYAGKVKQPNCIVGDGLVVHFSYFPTYQKMLDSGLLREFEVIVQKEVGALMERELWDALKYKKNQ